MYKLLPFRQRSTSQINVLHLTYGHDDRFNIHVCLLFSTANNYCSIYHYVCVYLDDWLQSQWSMHTCVIANCAQCAHASIVHTFKCTLRWIMNFLKTTHVTLFYIHRVDKQYTVSILVLNYCYGFWKVLVDFLL